MPEGLELAKGDNTLFFFGFFWIFKIFKKICDAGADADAFRETFLRDEM